MSPQIVLTEKLRRPEVAGLGRPRLEGPLLDPRSRLGLVVAPPGSGKTTLLARIAATAEIPVAWYRVTTDDADPQALLAHLARALRDALGLPVADTGIAALLGSLERRRGTDALVVLDDLHEIASTAAEATLEQFIMLRPHSIRVLVGSRRPPEMNIPRLRVSGALVEISSDDLRFRSWEVEELFISIFREPLSPEAAAALTRRTGGWAAGLQLFHLATSGRSAADRHHAVDALGGRSKLVRSYLARNVLAELPEERRQFMIKTCTLGTLTGALCDALLETTSSELILDELEQQQLFTSTDDDGLSFRYHEVLRTHLEWALVQACGPAGARSWYSRSAGLLETIGDRRGALRAYARAEDWGSVARLIKELAPDAGDAGAGGDVVLPAAVVQHDPWLSLAQARRHVREGSLEAAVDAFRRAEDLLDEPDFRASCRHERAVTQMWCGDPPLGQSWTLDVRFDQCHWSTPLREATLRKPELHRDSQDGNPGRRRAGTGTPHGPASTDVPDLLARALAGALHGDLGQARAVLTALPDETHADPTLQLLGRLAGTVLDLILDRCHDPSTELAQLAQDAEASGLPWLARLARGIQEAVLVAQGSPPWRVRACAEHLAECDRSGDLWGAALLRLAAAVARQACDQDAALEFDADPDAADFQGFADASDRFRRLHAPVPADWADALHAFFAARSADPRAADLATRAAANARSRQVTGAVEVALAAGRIARGDNPLPAERGSAEPGTVLDALTLLVRRSPVTMPAQGADEPEPAAAHQPAGSPNGSSVPAAPAAPAAPGRPGAVQVRCFGGFEMRIDGTPIDLGPMRPRARALLRLLALSADQDVHRERLVDALWPGADLAAGARRLQVAISGVRQVLEQAGLPGAEVIARRDGAYRLALPAGSDVDVRAFAQALREASEHSARSDVQAGMAARERALALYTGELLPEDGPAEYVVAERDHLRLAAATAAAALAGDHRDRGDHARAIEWARTSVQLDRFQDRAWDLLVDLHEESGDPAAAQRTRLDHARAQAELDLIAP